MAANYTDVATLYQQKNENASAIRALEARREDQPEEPRDPRRARDRLPAPGRGGEERRAERPGRAQLHLLHPTGLDTSSTLGSAFTSDPVSQALKTKASSSFTKLSSTYSKAESAYKRVAIASHGTSGEATAQLQLASIALEALNYTGQPTEIQTAIDAYKRYLAIDPKGPNAAQAKQALKQLQTFLPKSQR